jgi:C-terminal processing protease CtpA/Prc
MGPFKCEAGDEIISTDGLPSTRLEPVTLRRPVEILGNPNFGPKDSDAMLKVMRRGRILEFRVRRLQRPTGFRAAVLERPHAGVSHLRLYSLDSAALSTPQLKQVWSQIMQSRALIIDLRNCVGGDSKVTNVMAAWLLGAGKPLFRSVPRPETEEREVRDESSTGVPRFAGPVAVITNYNTESQAEIFAAICKEYRCARLFGERTAGAFNGGTMSVKLPGDFALFAVPFMRSVSPGGADYEGRGVIPDVPVEPTGRAGDQPLAAALRLVAKDLQRTGPAY